jgi:hypothetical protein
MEPTGLSKKSRVILEAIADGHSYEQILAQYPAWTYHDVSEAAAEALQASTANCPGLCTFRSATASSFVQNPACR